MTERLLTIPVEKKDRAPQLSAAEKRHLRLLAQESVQEDIAEGVPSIKFEREEERHGEVLARAFEREKNELN